MTERNVLGGALEPCGTEPVTGWFRDGSCRCSDGRTVDPGLHAVCVVLTQDFLAHQRELGNDLVTARPEWGFPGLRPGERWCVVAGRWLESYHAGRAAPVVLAATSELALQVVPVEALREASVDVPDDLSGLT